MAAVRNTSCLTAAHSASGAAAAASCLLFAVDDLAAAVSAVKARGVPVVMERDMAVCTMAMINDTEGNLVTLHQRKPK